MSTQVRDRPTAPAQEPGRDRVGRRGLRDRRWVFELGYGALAVLAVGLVLSPVARRPGWPIGQALGNYLTLTQIYAAHFRHHDFLPIWSSSDAYALGSPVLLYYQKAFFYVSGTLYILLGGAIKTSLLGSLALFLVLGAYGMRLALSTITESRLLQTVGSLGFLFTNYAFTNWLVRGDLAELSAMMVVPWLLYWCLNLIKNRRASFLIVPIMVLLVTSHNAIAMLSVITLVMALATFVVVAGANGLRAVAGRLVAWVALTTVVLAPLLTAQLRFSGSYDPATKVRAFGGDVSNNFYSLGQYFYDTSYQWLGSNPASHPVSPQLDFSLWMPIGAAIVGGAAALGVARLRGSKLAFRRYPHATLLAFLVITLGVYGLLQWRSLLWVYDIVSPLKVIDYPFRMLSFITPICVVLVVAIADAIWTRYRDGSVPKILWGAAVLWLAALVLLSPVTRPFRTDYGLLDRLAAGGQGPSHNYQFPPTALFDAPGYVRYGPGWGLLLYAEYLPKVQGANGKELYTDGALYHSLFASSHQASALGGGHCSIHEPPDTRFETLELRLTVSCSGATRVALPISYNAYTRVLAEGSDGKQHPVRYVHVPTDPRIVVGAPASGSEVLVVRLPTLGQVLF